MSRYLKLIGALYASDYERRTKICMYCGIVFSDITKRNLRNTCNDACHLMSMVAKRRANGTFIWSEEQKQKARESVKETYASRDVFGPELRQKFSETMKRSWAENKIDTTNHWTKTLEGRASISARVKGRKLGPQPNMSLASQQRIRSKRETLYTSARGGFREDVGMYFRSCWEANFARILNVQNKRWSYEEHTFQLEPSFSYTPDFFVIDENAFYELKGRMDTKSSRQLELMRKKFPHVTLHVIDSVKYGQLRVQFQQQLVSTWEGK